MSLRVRLLAILVGLAVAGSGVLIATRVSGDDETGQRGRSLTDIRRATAFSPVVSGQPQIARTIPGYEPCGRPGPGCRFVELTLARYAEIADEDPALFLHVDTDVRPCPRPEGPEEAVGEPPCRETAENLTVTFLLRAEAADAFVRDFGCGTAVVDPCR